MNFWNAITSEQHLLPWPDTPHGPIGHIYPNTYSVGMASLGYQQIYRMFQECGFSVERIFLDRKGRETTSIENRTPLFRFPVITASYTYELDIIHIVQMLYRGGVAPLSEQRTDLSPVFIVGGQAATANPRLLERIADAVVLGDGERTVQRIAHSLVTTQGKPRSAILEALAEIPHIWVPTVHGAFNPDLFRANSIDPLDEYDSHSVILSPDDEFGGAFLLEVSRGCMYRCKFCIVHYMNGTARYRNVDHLIRILDTYRDHYRKVGLLGAAVADHPQVEDVAEWLVRHNKQVSTSSLRAERITERFLDLLREGGQHNITVAPETGGMETRKMMRKGVKHEKYYRLAEWAGRRRFPAMKLYFVLGIPGGEPMQEANDIIEFGREMSERFSGNGGGRLTLTVSPFVPKPTTPWADGNLWEPKTIKKASRIIRKELAFRGNVKVPPVNVKEARLETILSWSGAEITDDLLRLAQGEISLESAFRDFDVHSLHRAPEEAVLPHETVLKYNAMVKK